VPLFGDVPHLHPEQMTLPGTVQLWPHRQGTDAMFLALLRRG
jgi:16S rRNA C967 or C1407 C5-methylase (RsmB/RsmF family)